ncbi:MAG: IS21 family transposase [Betaproteobacteria bacterium]|nr:IS21 family transposase [Betaproteobacteria bacterium]
MLTQEQAVEIRVLARQGLPIREIARRMNCSRNTVRRYLREPEAVTYSPRAPRPTKLDPFEPYLLERIAAARPDWIPASVLLREVRERGYDGGYSQIKAFVARHRPQPAEDPVVRFETEPGHQMQADFTVIRRGRDPLLAFVATLGYSRASFVRFSAREDSPAWCSGLEHAFDYFGGVPRTVLFDNAKTVITERDVFGPGLHRWNPELLRLADRYGFAPRVCRPYRARTKGKVERFNGYLKGSFIVPLAASLRASGLLLDVATANGRIGPWLDEVANARIHATTGERPAHRLATERHRLLPLPAFHRAELPTTPARTPVPFESLQHPLSVYQALLEVPA